MRVQVFYIVRATTHVASGQATVWVGRKTKAVLKVWCLEVLRVLWQSMGTAETARWVTGEYALACPEAVQEVGTEALAEALAEAVAQALGQAESFYKQAY